MSLVETQARATYEVWHERVESDQSAADQPWHALVFKYLSPKDVEGRRVLEIGCGRGELACAIAAWEPGPSHFIAADFAQSAVRLGRRRALAGAAPGLSWLVADVQDIALPDASIDTIVSCETIEHLLDPQKALHEFHRILRPGGRLVLTTPNYLGPFGLYWAYLRLRGRRYTEGDQPICRVTMLPRTLAWIRRAGFRVEKVDTVGHYVLLPGRRPWEPSFLKRLHWLLWPFGLHSVVVARRP